MTPPNEPHKLHASDRNHTQPVLRKVKQRYRVSLMRLLAVVVTLEQSETADTSTS